jgi:hypothetical protein
MQSWTAVDGECVFATLRHSFPWGPRDERDVEQFAIELERLWQRLRNLHPGEPAAQDGDLDATARRDRQREADAEDRALAPPDRLECSASRTGGASLMDPLLDEAVHLSDVEWGEAAELLLDSAVRAEVCGESAVWDDRAGRRFCGLDLDRVLTRASEIHHPLDRQETRALERLDRERSADGDLWEWGSERKTVITRPLADDEDRRRYDEAWEVVRTQVAAMRAVFRLRLGARVRHQHELAAGRLDRRRLACALLTDRIYRRTNVTSEGGLAVCLLLDESGSMSQGEPSRGEVALQATVLVVEALKAVPGIELEVYSHSSCGQSDRDCLVRCLYGRENLSPAAIGSYSPKRENYDHQAILTAAKLFVRNTTNLNRIMLVLSDGAPAGKDYEGESAVRMTRQAVEAVRRRGIRVLNVAICDYHSETIFGRHVVKYTDLDRLVSDMRTLITRIIRQATESV